MLTEEAKREIANLIDDKMLEDIFYIVKMYREYDEIFNYINNKMSDYDVVKANKVGLLVVVAMNSENEKEFKSRVLL